MRILLNTKLEGVFRVQKGEIKNSLKSSIFLHSEILHIRPRLCQEKIRKYAINLLETSFNPGPICAVMAAI